MIPKSGGDYAYIGAAFGPLPAFLYLWAALLILVPTGNAITALTFAQYLLQPFWPTCDAPMDAVRLLAAVITCKNTILFIFLLKFRVHGAYFQHSSLFRWFNVDQLLQCKMGCTSYRHFHGHENCRFTSHRGNGRMAFNRRQYRIFPTAI